MKKLNALLPIIATSFIVGCGGGSSNSTVDPMTERDLIGIFYHSPTGMCENVEFQNYLKDSIAAEGYVIDYYLFREETNDVSCATYDRAEGITETGGCMTYDLVLDDPNFSVYNTSCVIGMDLDPYAQPTDIVSKINSAIQGW